jgi:hypothetical protein
VAGNTQVNRKIQLLAGDRKIRLLNEQYPSAAKVHEKLDELSNTHDEPDTTFTETEDVKFVLM